MLKKSGKAKVKLTEEGECPVCFAGIESGDGHNEGCKYHYYLFLNRLRESGITNMWGSPAYLVKEFYFDNKDAQDIVSSWMKWVSDNPKNRDL